MRQAVAHELGSSSIFAKEALVALLEEWNHPGDNFDGLLGFVMSNSYKVKSADLTFSLTHISDYQLKYAFN